MLDTLYSPNNTKLSLGFLEMAFGQKVAPQAKIILMLQNYVICKHMVAEKGNEILGLL